MPWEGEGRRGEGGLPWEEGGGGVRGQRDLRVVPVVESQLFGILSGQLYGQPGPVHRRHSHVVLYT